MTGPTAAGASRREALAVLAGLAALRLAHALAAPPNSDEAYYWLWGRHPALSYFDHPPLHAWLQGLVHALLGTSLLALRLGPALTSVASGLLVWRLARRVAPGAPAAGALAAAAFFASPLLGMLCAFAWNDHLLLLGWLAAGSLALEFLDEVRRGLPGRSRLLYGAALALGLAGLAKYSAVFLGLAVLAVVATDPALRHLLRQPRLWLAGLLALAILSPVLAWNAARGGASFHFHLVERVTGHGGLRLQPAGLLRFALPLLLAVGPFLALAVLRPAAGAAPGVAGGPGGPGSAGGYAALHRRLALWALALPTAAFALLSLLAPALYYWDVVGWLLLVPLAPAAGRPAWLRGHLATGLLATALMTAHATLLPLTVFFPGVQDDDSAMTWGWDEVAEAVRAARRERSVGLVAASDYRSAASLAFALDDPGVVAFSGRRSQFDEWLAQAPPSGDALLVVEPREPMTPALAGRFGAVRLLAEIEARRFGRPVKRYELWLGEGYRGTPAAGRLSAARP